MVMPVTIGSPSGQLLRTNDDSTFARLGWVAMQVTGVAGFGRRMTRRDDL